MVGSKVTRGKEREAIHQYNIASTGSLNDIQPFETLCHLTGNIRVIVYKIQTVGISARYKCVGKRSNDPFSDGCRLHDVCNG